MNIGNEQCRTPEQLARLMRQKSAGPPMLLKAPATLKSHYPRTLVVHLAAMGAVRQTQSDKWKKRPAVIAYREYCDALRAALPNFIMPESGYHLTFYLPIPESWSKKRKLQYEGAAHKSKPDKDNLEKAFLDALCESDQHVWDGRVTKRWSARPRIVLRIEPTERPTP